MELTKEKVKKDTLDKLLTVDDLVDIMRVPRTTIKLMIASGEIPSMKIGRHRRFLPEEIQKWMRKKSA